MRLSKEDVDAKIVELYKSGCSFRQLQKRYHKSPNYIAKLVNSIEVTCTACGKPKGKVHFHAHHPDRINQPDYTIPLCPSCHVIEEARLRRERNNKSQSLTLFNKTSTALIKTEDALSQQSTPPLSFSYGPLSPKAKKILTCTVIAMLAETLSPGFFERRWQEIQDHLHKT